MCAYHLSCNSSTVPIRKPTLKTATRRPGGERRLATPRSFCPKTLPFANLTPEAVYITEKAWVIASQCHNSNNERRFTETRRSHSATSISDLLLLLPVYPTASTISPHSHTQTNPSPPYSIPPPSPTPQQTPTPPSSPQTDNPHYTAPSQWG